MIGETVDGKYQILRLLGQGGMGSVYEAAPVDGGAHVALKRIEGSVLARRNSSGIGRFYREARAASAIDTEHIVRVLDSGTDPATKAPYMVMELLAGEDLEQLLDRIGTLKPSTALRIAAQICLGLEKAHEARVVHRDIKPANIFLSRREAGEIVVKILDFGIAKIKQDPTQAGQTTGLTRTGGILGSPLYMSPEQARGLKDIGYPTDLWSLGVVLYRALSGKVPNQEIEAFGDLIMTICSKPPRPIQEIAPWVPPEVAAVVHGALRLEPGERFASATAMLEAIKPLLPSGWALQEDRLVSIGDKTRATSAPKLLMFDTTQSASPKGAAPEAQAGTTGEPTTTAADDAGSSRRAGAARRGARWTATMAAGGTVVVGLGVLGLVQALRASPGAQTESPLPSAFSAAAPPPAPPVSSTPAVAAVPTREHVKLAVAPLDVSVEVDGVPARVEAGAADIEGALGSVHRVRLLKGKRELSGEVIVTAGGASPAKMDLDAATPAAAGTPGAKGADRPVGKVTGQAAAPKPEPKGRPLIPDTF